MANSGALGQHRPAIEGAPSAASGTTTPWHRCRSLATACRRGTRGDSGRESCTALLARGRTLTLLSRSASAKQAPGPQHQHAERRPAFSGRFCPSRHAARVAAQTQSGRSRRSGRLPEPLTRPAAARPSRKARHRGTSAAARVRRLARLAAWGTRLPHLALGGCERRDAGDLPAAAQCDSGAARDF
ncbi:hypothetical protein FA09DRAFT_92493 [Tilletiopsis washingtonensis]|uniref:Uncharacterized protein n=1 Tax=Tilletiopsis washingtonensis TaxID=58919 RepID=A0A316Z4L0_9BASI|nr:hypothetical protein FA09DRAFT_92493 [Tilletiopsis washingtonensis]PWN96529.1 hypothetical protein FA09DRAFT_92493 [Tilletiopsis washingtonensis]